MVMVDTSAWIEFLRNGDKQIAAAVEASLRRGDAATTDAVGMELLAGARDEQHARRLAALIARTTMIPTEARHYVTAATMYRACRVGGATVRRLIDCLIGAVAADAGLPVLHNDRDFDVLARFTPLQVARGSTRR